MLLPQSGEWLGTLRVSGKNRGTGEEPRAHVQARIESTISKYATGQIVAQRPIESENSAFPNDRTLRRSSSNTLHRLKR